jgi:hypothetical protein
MAAGGGRSGRGGSVRRVNGQVPSQQPPRQQVIDCGSVYYSPYDSDTISYKLRGLLTVTVPSLATVTMS